jgi:hypothetical protein
MRPQCRCSIPATAAPRPVSYGRPYGSQASRASGPKSIALVELSSPSLPPDAGAEFEAKIVAGSRFNSSTLAAQEARTADCRVTGTEVFTTRDCARV